MESNPLAILILQMKQKIPFSTVDMQSKWDYLLHLERGAPVAHKVRSRAEAETVAGAGKQSRTPAAPATSTPLLGSRDLLPLLYLSEAFLFLELLLRIANTSNPFFDPTRRSD